MSGHNPHGHWNHLQVPPYIPRQPQLAHMSNERPNMRYDTPPWHPSAPAPEALLNFLTASANHSKSLDIPLLPYVTNNGPTGSVDLTLPTARNSLTPSPHHLQHSPGGFGPTNLSSTTPPPLPLPNNLVCNRNSSPTPVIQTLASVKAAPNVMGNGETNVSGKYHGGPPVPINFQQEEPVELVKDSIINHTSQSSPQEGGSIKHQRQQNPHSPTNNNLNSSEDSIDSNSSNSKARRKRKPERTNRIATAPDGLTVAENPPPLAENKNEVNDSLSDSFKSKESINSSTPTKIVESEKLDDRAAALNDSISSENSKFDDKNDPDDFETIDKIAEMIAKTNNECKMRPADEPPSVITHSVIDGKKPEVVDSEVHDLEKTLNGSICDSRLSNFDDSQRTAADNDPSVANGENKDPKSGDTSYEDVENKLEELFAGIEDDRPSLAKSINMTTTIETLPVPQDHCEKNDLESAENLENGQLEEETIQIKTKAAVKRTKKNESGGDGPPPKRKRKVKRGVAKGRNNKIATSTPKGGGGGGANSQAATPNNKSMNKNGKLLVNRDDQYRGPYVHVRHNGEITVVNCPNSEDVAGKNSNESKIKKPLPNSSTSERNHIRGLHVSTLSMKYDADTRDTSWICVFCKIGPHKSGLGDLFGPYILSTDCEDFQLSQLDPANDVFKSKRTKQDMIQKYIAGKKIADATTKNVAGPPPSGISNKKKKKIGSTEDHLNPTTTPSTSSDIKPLVGEEHQQQQEVNIFEGMTIASDSTYEVWIHEDCAVWSPDIHIVGVRILGLESSVWSSTRHFCTICSKNGAMLCCLQRGCSNKVHIPCAKLNNWTLNDMDFKSYCDLHRPVLSGENNNTS